MIWTLYPNNDVHCTETKHGLYTSLRSTTPMYWRWNSLMISLMTLQLYHSTSFSNISWSSRNWPSLYPITLGTSSEKISPMVDMDRTLSLCFQASDHRLGSPRPEARWTVTMAVSSTLRDVSYASYVGAFSLPISSAAWTKCWLLL